VEAVISVLDAEGFAHTSARVVAQAAGVAPGVIYYHFESMDGLLAAALDAVTEQRLDRMRVALANDPADEADGPWSARLVAAIRHEVEGAAGSAALEMTIGAKTSPQLAEAARRNLDRSVEMVAAFCGAALADAGVTSPVSAELIAEVAASCFLGLEVFAQLGRPIDIDAIVLPLVVLFGSLDAT